MNSIFNRNKYLTIKQPNVFKRIGLEIKAKNLTILPGKNRLQETFIQSIFVLLILTFSSWTLIAHSPDVSTTMLVQQKDGTWILQIKSALTAFEREINYRCGKDAYGSPEGFRVLVIEHLKENLSVVFNDEKNAQLTRGLVNLGHETNVMFKVLDVPDNFSSVTIKNSSFKNIYYSQSALMVFKDGFEKNQFILNRKNNYSAALKVNKNNFELKK